MPEIETIFILIAAVAALATLANRIGVPYPILLVLGGLVLGFVPGLPRIELQPNVVFLLFLPPLLYISAIFTSWRDFRANLRKISMLAVGLVLVTVCAVAAVAHWAVGLPWAAAFVLGAIVSPTDAVAATAIAQRLGIPRRIVTILEGESLINDATGIVAYRVAVAAVVTGAFSLWQAGLQFVIGAIGGVTVGLAVGWLVVWARRHVSEEPNVQNTISLLTPFAAYLLAEEPSHYLWGRLGLPGEFTFSGVLAVVTAGLYLARRVPYVVTPQARLQAYAFWELVIFLLNGLIFALIGLQLRSIVERLSESEYEVAQLVLYAGLISLTVVLVRFLWVFSTAYFPRWERRSLRWPDPLPSPRGATVISWTGMRGVISLAAALSLPLSVEGGAPFPGRDLILFLTFAVILATLVVQGLSLPALIRGLEDDGPAEQEEVQGRIKVAESALARLEELAEEEWVREDTAERVRGLYTYRRSRFVARLDGDEDGLEERSSAYQRLLRELLRAQRQTLIQLRNGGSIGDEVMHRIEHDLDLEESRLEVTPT
ncbi:MAG: monovalent cation/hydrogen antiporter [Rubrobacteraceae bacterium]|nr:monovalent cation/hydrogen antiporter [Rubrobacteraceae bacterium]